MRPRPLCLPHAREHGAAESECDKAIDFALAALINDGILPFISALESFPAIDTAKIGRDIFPVVSSWTEIIDSVSDLHAQMLDILRLKLGQFTAALRERFEGDAMPFGLSDDEAWAWYKHHVTGEDAEH
ncbi:MAG TPA: hypothetical protein VF659_09355 [Pyrinomonadaceae bacterium]|jgi:hypothetical protein